jgi:hypothetical protein
MRAHVACARARASASTQPRVYPRARAARGWGPGASAYDLVADPLGRDQPRGAASLRVLRQLVRLPHRTRAGSHRMVHARSTQKQARPPRARAETDVPRCAARLPMGHVAPRCATLRHVATARPQTHPSTCTVRARCGHVRALAAMPCHVHSVTGTERAACERAHAWRCRLRGWAHLLEICAGMSMNSEPRG